MVLGETKAFKTGLKNHKLQKKMLIIFFNQNKNSLFLCDIKCYKNKKNILGENICKMYIS